MHVLKNWFFLRATQPLMLSILGCAPVQDCSGHAGFLPVPLRVKNRFKFLFSKGFKGALACVFFCRILTKGHSRAQAGASASCQPLAIPPKKSNRPNHPQEQTLRDCLDNVSHALKLSLRLCKRANVAQQNSFIVYSGSSSGARSNGRRILTGKGAQKGCR